MGNTHIIMNAKKSAPKNIQRVAPSPLTGTYFRSVSLGYQREFLDTQGSFEHGGRYNPVGEFGALYMSDSEELCKVEVQKRIKPDCADLQTTRKIKASLARVLDLTNPKNLRKLGITKQDLIQERSRGGWALTQDIARAAYKSGYEAILAPSATSKGNNLVIFDQYVDAAKINSYKHLA